MQFNRILVGVMTASVMMASQSGFAARIIDNENTKAVNNVRWQKAESVRADELLNNAIPSGAASLFFVRAPSNDNIQSSANIAINDRFQVSLQPGRFSQVYSCAGVNQISGDITGHKNNDLSRLPLTFNLNPQDSYFFYVDVVDETNVTIKHITKDSALAIAKDMPQQAHQISRVVPDCPAEPEMVALPVIPVAPPQLTPEEPAKVRHVIDLEVLFDTDKSVVKSAYEVKVKEAADFLNAHPTAVVAIEGHTDSRASAEYNQALSQRRVNAVRTLLVDKYGIASDRINAVGYGESRPVASNDTREGRQRNRRVVAVFDY